MFSFAFFQIRRQRLGVVLCEVYRLMWMEGKGGNDEDKTKRDSSPIQNKYSSLLRTLSTHILKFFSMQTCI